MSACGAARVCKCRSVSSARSSAHPAPLKLRIQATLDFRVNSAPSQLQRSASACQGQRSREMAWRVQWRVGSASAAHRRECESANGDHEASSESQAPASITALVPIDATDSPCGIILRRNRCRCSSSGSSSWLCGTAGRLRCCCAPGCSLGSIGGSFAQEPYIDANSKLISALARSEHHAVVTPTVVRTFASRAHRENGARAQRAQTLTG